MQLIRTSGVLTGGERAIANRQKVSRSDHRVRLSLGISGFGDLGRDYEDGFQEGVVPKGEIGHVGYHVTRKMTSEDYTSRRDLESSETLARDLET